MLVIASIFLLVAISQMSMAKRLLFFSNFSVFLGVWAALLFFYSLNLSAFPKLDGLLVFYIFIFFALYILVYFIVATGFRRPSAAASNPFQIDRLNHRLAKQLWFGAGMSFVLWAVLFADFVGSLSSIGGVVFLLTSGGARAALHDAADVSVTYYVFAYLFLIVSVLLAPHCTKLMRFLIYASMLIVVISLLLTAAKMNFISAAFLVYTMWFNRENFGLRKFLRHSGIIALFGYAFIFLFTLYTGKVVDQSVGSVSSISDILNFGKSAFLYPYDYFAGSLAALSHEYNILPKSSPSSHFGAYSFYSVYQIASAFGLFTDTSTLPDQFYGFVTFGHVTTNVYTFFYDLFLDFGEIGTLLFAPLLGVLHASLDMREAKGSNIYLIILSNVSKLSAFVSFVNFRYGDTVFVFTFSLWALALIFFAYGQRKQALAHL